MLSGYAHWARSFNLHEASKTLIFLQECGLKSLEELDEKAAAASSDFRTRTASIKAADTRMDEIRELQIQISNYSRTREVYKQYRASGYSAKFRDNHESDIILHQAAKRHFDSLGLKKLPTIAALKQEYAALLADKKKQYAGYREAKEYSRALVMKQFFLKRVGPSLHRYYIYIMVAVILALTLAPIALAGVVADRIIKDVYGKIAGVSTVLAGLMSAVAVVGAKLSNNQHKTDQAWDWLKRIWIAWAIINGIGAFLAYIRPLFDGLATIS